MEKRKVITCVYSAIEDGTIKGDMSDNHKEFVFNTIKTTNQAGDESTWTIKDVAYDKDNAKNIMLFVSVKLVMAGIGVFSQNTDKNLGFS